MGAPPGPVLVPALAGSSGLPVWPPAAAPGLRPLAKHPPPVAPPKVHITPLSWPCLFRSSTPLSVGCEAEDWDSSCIKYSPLTA